MDYLLSAADSYVFTPYVYPASFTADNAARQFVSLFVLVNVGAVLLYFSASGLAWLLMFDKRLRSHKLFLRDQVISAVLSPPPESSTAARTAPRQQEPMATRA